MNSYLSIENITPQTAQEWLQYNIDNRRLRTAHVEFLAKEMRYGRFQETAEIHLFTVGDVRYMLNGQHTCHAVVLYGAPVRVTVRRSSGTENERRMVYSVGHDKGLSRTFSDSVRVYDLADSMQVRSSYIDRIAASIRYAELNFGLKPPHTRRVSDIELMGIVPLWDTEMALLLETISPCAKEMRNTITRSDLLSVALITLFFQTDKAVDFWRGVAKGDLLPDDDARKRLRDYLVKVKWNNRSLSDKPSVITRRVVDCWNKFYDGREAKRVLQDRHIRDEVCINGTLYTGKQPFDYWPDKQRLRKAA